MRLEGKRSQEARGMLLFASPMGGSPIDLPPEVFQCCCFEPMLGLIVIFGFIGLRILIK